MPRCPVRSRNLASSTTYPALCMNMNLTRSEIELIGKSLIRAERPLVITGYLGRNVRAPPLLEALCDRLPIEVIETIGSDLCISSAHEAYRGVTISTHPLVPDADVILVLDCDVPWVPTQGTPSKGQSPITLPRLGQSSCLGQGASSIAMPD